MKRDFCLIGMASLFGTVSFAVARLLIMRKKDNLWLETEKLSPMSILQLQLSWLLALSFSVPPLFGYGRYSKDMIGIRYCNYDDIQIQNLALIFLLLRKSSIQLL